jgi:predicted ATPase
VRFIVLTGGPGAGKTAVLEVVRRHFSEHVVVLRESASIVFGGGFPRRDTAPARRAAQRAIFRVQRELERLAVEEGGARVVLCDRGTVDGEAYWPSGPTTFWDDLGVSREAELARYAAVIHLRPPLEGHGYNHDNAIRVETASQAQRIDERIARAWSGHPRRTFVESTERFTDKLETVLGLLHTEIPIAAARDAELSAAP